jgi:phosphoglycolate phosphatase
MSVRSAIFDLDGTLADTAADLVAAANHCLAAAGAAARLDPVADRATAFRGGKAMLRLGFAREGREDPDLADRLYPELLAAYDRAIARETRLFPGAVDALDRLAAAGWRLGICTNKPEGLARKLLGELGVLARFAALVGAGAVPSRKPDPAMLHETLRRMGVKAAGAVLIGDTATDRDTARAAGIRCVLVPFGADGPAVAALEPDAIAPDLGALPALLDRLLPAEGA